MADVREDHDDQDDLESDARAAERLTFFSDAVIAIALELHSASAHRRRGSGDRPSG